MKRKLKRVLPLLLTVSVILSSVNITMITAEENVTVIDESFDGYTSISDLPTDWSKDALAKIEDVDGHGKALRLELKSTDNARVTRYNLKNPIKEGILKFTYSFLPDKGVSTMFAIGDSSGNLFFPTYIHNAGGQLVAGGGSATFAERIIRTESAAGIWHHAEVYLDIDKQLWKADIRTDDGKEYTRPWTTLTDSRETRELKDFSNFRLQMWSNVNAVSYFDDIKIETVPVRCSVNTVRTGGVYAREDEQAIDLVWEKLGESDCNVKYTWKAKEEEKGTLLSGGKTVTLSGENGETEKVDISSLPYGTYNLELEMEITCSDGRVLKETRLTPFSKVFSCDEGEKSTFFGLATHIYTFGRVTYDEGIEYARISGTHTIRDPFYSWNTSEKTKGVLQAPNGLMSELKNKQVGAIYQLAYGNLLYVKQVDAVGDPTSNNLQRAPTTNEEIAGFANYCRYMAEQGKDTISYYEIWNEFDGYMNPNRVDGSGYVRILKAAYEAIKEVNPDAVVIGIGGLGLNSAGEHFLRQFCEAGGLYYCDAISFHPYSTNAGFPRQDWIDNLQAFIDVVNEYGECPPVYLTEMGWHTAENYAQKATKVPVTEKEQAENMVKLAALNATHKYAAGISIHDLMQNHYSWNNDNIEASYGIMTGPFHPYGHGVALPAYLSFTAVNKMMAGGVEPMGAIESEDWSQAFYCYKKNKGGNLAVLYSENTNTDVAFDLGCTTAEVFDKYGNSLGTLYSENGIFNVSMTDRILFLTGNFTKFEQVTPTFKSNESVITITKNDVATITVTDSNGGNYKSDVEFNTDEFTLVEKTDMVNGKMTLKIRAGGETKGEFPVIVKLSDDSGMRYVLADYISVLAPMEVTVETAQAGNTTNWEFAVKIKNCGVYERISGVCTITEPTEFASEMKSAEFYDIPAGETRTIYMSLPALQKKFNTTVKGKIELDFGHTQEFEQKIDFTSANYAYTKPTIDGVIDDGEWIGSVLCAERPENVKLHNGSYVTPITNSDDAYAKWGGKDNLSITATKLMWDEENLYLMAVVKDDIHVSCADVSRVWYNDSIQIGIEDEYYNVANRMSYPFTEIGIGEKDGKAVAWRYSVQYTKPVGELTNFKGAVKHKDGKTVYEVSIPWSELFKDGYEVDPNLDFSFSMLANDDDGNGRWAYCEYNSGIGQYKNAAEFGRMKLYK